MNLIDIVNMKRYKDTIPVTFQRPGVAFDYKGREVLPDTPRMVHMRNGELINALLIEEEHPNLLTANQSTGTDTLGNTTGFETPNSVITSSTEQSYCGTRSVKVVTPGTARYETAQTTKTNTTPNTTHTAGVRVLAPSGALMYLELLNQLANKSFGYVLFTGTGKWQDVAISKTTSGDSTGTIIRVGTWMQQAITFYVDTLQLIEKPYPLSWTLGGTTQPAEALQLPGYTVNPMSGTVEVEAYIESHHKGRAWVLLDQYNKMRVIHTSDGFLQFQTNNGVDTTTTTPGIPDTDLKDGFNRITARYNEDEISIMVNGNPDTLSTAEDPYLPDTNTEPLTLDNSFNGLIRELTISKTSRPIHDTVARATRPVGKGFGVDRQVTIHAPLQHNLHAYKLRGV